MNPLNAAPRLLWAAALALPLTVFAAPAKEKAPEYKETQCHKCHKEVRDLWTGGKHTGKVKCHDCHSGLALHLDEPDVNKPALDLNPEACGSCHKNQFESFFKANHKKPARLEKSLLTERAPNPFWDKLMAGHGFTKEHNAPRSHGYMVVDHVAVDRAYGGRFQPKNGWEYVVARPPLKTWDVLQDTQPTNEHKAYLPETAAAANATCLQCKTSDFIKKWKYMGDQDPKAKWWRGSNVVDAAKDVNNVVGCIQCHDPHGGKPRIVRDALIQALNRPEADTLWHKDPKRTNVQFVDFDGFRKIGVLEKSDAKLQCGQCHVEYNCNPGYERTTGEKIGFSDPRTNHFPFKDVLQIYDHYNALNFRDFKHTATGGLLFKAQHPETEVFWNSVHDQKGVSCNDCHMPKMKGKDGKTFTSHWQTSPRNYLKETCLRCHDKWTPEEALTSIDSVKVYVRGKMRKAEFNISALIDRIVEAKKLGVDEALIKQAQEQHQKAHVLWEWWTAENSDGFHNPQQARESLTRSMEESKKGMELLAKAIEAKWAGGKATAAAPAAAPAPAPKK